MNTSPKLERLAANCRTEADFWRQSGTVYGNTLLLRDRLEEVEALAKTIAYETGGDAAERAQELEDFIARDVIPDWLLPLERAVKEWLDEQERAE